MRTALLSLLLLATPVLAETPRDFLTRYEQEAGTRGNAVRGGQFFNGKHGGEWGCASCHTDNPVSGGRHAKTDKPIKPMAPAANGERFTDPAKVEKWFRRNCNDVLNRECSAGERADVVAYLLAAK